MNHDAINNQRVEIQPTMFIEQISTTTRQIPRDTVIIK